MFREMRIKEWFHSLLGDCRFAFRQIRKSPAFTVVAVLTLALGIGSSTAIFSTIDGTLLHPYPYKHAERLATFRVVIYYGPRIFELAGIGTHKNAIFATLLVAVMNVLATVVGIVLVDRVGRKPLLYVGVTGMAASLFALSWGFGHKGALTTSLGYLAVASLLCYIACFALSLGAIAWILVSEVFPLRVRARGVAIATLASGLSNFAVSLTFLSMINTLGDSATFAIYGVLSVVTLVFVRFAVPETCRRDLESISSHNREAVAPPQSVAS